MWLYQDGPRARRLVTGSGAGCQRFSALAIRRAVEGPSTLHSQTLRTFQPRLRSIAATLLSRRRLALNFDSQKSELRLGER